MIPPLAQELYRITIFGLGFAVQQPKTGFIPLLLLNLIFKRLEFIKFVKHPKTIQDKGFICGHNT